MSKLELVDVSASYDGVPVLRSISLTIESGSIVAVLGSSGAGKTTLLRVLAGFQRVDSGVIRIDGADIATPTSQLRPEHRGVTIVPQEHALFPHLNVRDNIGFGVAKGVRKRRVDELLELTGLHGFDKRMPHQLSGGQQQRVALARALAPRPAVILLDEPFSGLDAAMRDSIRSETAALLRSTGATALFVTHDQEEALSIADQVAVLRDGEVVQFDAPSALYAGPADANTAAFIGDANLLRGNVSAGVVECPLGSFSASSLPDGAVTVMVRPEHLALTAGLDGPVVATVLECLYYGHDAMVIARLNSGEEVRVRVQGELPERGSMTGLIVKADPVYFPTPA